MRKPFLKILSSDPSNVTRITDAEAANLLREENQKLSSEAKQLRDELLNIKSKLDKTKQKLNKSRNLQDSLIEEGAETRKKFRKENEDLESKIDKLTNKRNNLLSQVEEKTRECTNHTTTAEEQSKLYDALSKKYKIARFSCIGLIVILLILGLLNWHTIVAFSLGFVKLSAKLIALAMSI